MLQLPCHDLRAADVGMERLLPQHHVEAAVPVGEDPLPCEPRGCPFLGVVGDATKSMKLDSTATAYSRVCSRPGTTAGS